MNYQENTTRWLKGDIVIHDIDAKEPKMLMKVVGYTRDGLCKTQYCGKEHKRTVYKNELKYLHAPEMFGIKSIWGEYRQDLLDKVQTSWLRVKNWNAKFPEDMPVIAWDTGGDRYSKVRGKAYMDAGGHGFIWVEGLGNWSLDFIVPDTEKEIAQP